MAVYTENATVHWLTNDSNNGVLSSSHSILYAIGFHKIDTSGAIIASPKNEIKVGQIHNKNLDGLIPEVAIQNRYVDGSGRDTHVVVYHLFIVDRFHNNVSDVDNGVRRLIHRLFSMSMIPFDANFPTYVASGTINKEALSGYQNDVHSRHLIDAVKQYYGLAHTFNTHKKSVPRTYQVPVIEQAVHILRESHVCLLAAYASFGKTITALEIITSLLPKGGLVLFTTPIVDTITSLKSNADSYQFGDDRTTIITIMESGEYAMSSMEDIKSRTTAGETIIIALGVQDMRWQDDVTSSDELRIKYADLSGNVDFWICDERHFQYEGAVTGQKLKNINATYTLDLTATPYNISDRYYPEQTIDRGLVWGLTNRDQTNLPEVFIEIVNTQFCKANPVISAIYSEEEGFDPRKLFAMDNGQFIQITSIEQMRDAFYGTGMSKQKNTLSISADTQLSTVAKRCGMWVLPSGEGESSSTDYIPQLANVLNTGQTHTFFIASYDVTNGFPKSTTTGECVESLLAIHNRVVILTCKKFTTGTDIPAMGHLVIFDKRESLAEFEQLLGRTLRIYDGKNSVKVYSLTPGYSLKTTIGKMITHNSDMGGTQEHTYYDCLSFMEYNTEGARVLVDITEVLSLAQEWCNSQITNGKLPDSQLRNAIHGFDKQVWDSATLVGAVTRIEAQELSDDSEAKVMDTTLIPSQTPPNTVTGDISLDNAIRETIQAIIWDARWVCYSAKCYDYRIVFKNTDLIAIYGEDAMSAILKSAEDSAEFSKMLRADFRNKRDTYSSLSERQVYSMIFSNTNIKQKRGLVYVVFKLADELVSQIPTEIADGTVMIVINALNGSIPFALRELYPTANIICVETHDYHKQYLTTLGFRVVDYTEVDTIEKEFQMSEQHVVVGNPPYQDGDKKGGQNKIYNPICKKLLSMMSNTGTAVLVTPTSVLKDNKRFSVIGQAGLKLVNFNAAKHFSVGIDICYWVIDKTFSGNVTVIYDDVITYCPNDKPIRNFNKINKDFCELYDNLKIITHAPALRMFMLNAVDTVTGRSKIQDSVFQYPVHKINRAGQKQIAQFNKPIPKFHTQLKLIVPMTKTLTEKAIIISYEDYDVGYLCTNIANADEADNIKSFICSDYFIAHCAQWRKVDGYGFNYGLKHLPPFDKTVYWSNADVEQFIEGFR